jgi:hypothetical protein
MFSKTRRATLLLSATAASAAIVRGQVGFRSSPFVFLT